MKMAGAFYLTCIYFHVIASNLQNRHFGGIIYLNIRQAGVLLMAVQPRKRAGNKE